MANIASASLNEAFDPAEPVDPVEPEPAVALEVAAGVDADEEVGPCPLWSPAPAVELLAVLPQADSSRAPPRRAAGTVRARRRPLVVLVLVVLVLLLVVVLVMVVFLRVCWS